jgi:hypothetical protein
MNEDADLGFLKRRVAELEGGDLLTSLEAPSSKSESSGANDRWQSGIEALLMEVKTDLRYLRANVAALDGATATLRERVARLPSSAFIAAVSFVTLALISSLIVFQGPIQAFLKLAH